mmetsp:Transcript_3518/g.10230  ORF Transcript_3518/g.10230 Transcript_3518/m.10230 type:complete len:292 (+) Transcript_3518:690-1565(+)
MAPEGLKRQLCIGLRWQEMERASASCARSGVTLSISHSLSVPSDPCRNQTLKGRSQPFTPAASRASTATGGHKILSCASTFGGSKVLVFLLGTKISLLRFDCWRQRSHSSAEHDARVPRLRLILPLDQGERTRNSAFASRSPFLDARSSCSASKQRSLLFVIKAMGDYSTGDRRKIKQRNGAHNAQQRKAADKRRNEAEHFVAAAFTAHRKKDFFCRHQSNAEIILKSPDLATRDGARTAEATRPAARLASQQKTLPRWPTSVTSSHDTSGRCARCRIVSLRNSGESLWLS